MNIHKLNIKSGGSLCGSTEYKTSTVARNWVSVNCKHCLNYSNLRKILEKIAYIQKRIEYFEDLLEKEYVKEKEFYNQSGITR